MRHAEYDIHIRSPWGGKCRSGYIPKHVNKRCSNPADFDLAVTDDRGQQKGWHDLCSLCCEQYIRVILEDGWDGLPEIRRKPEEMKL
jgi:hypothetical protein